MNNKKQVTVLLEQPSLDMIAEIGKKTGNSSVTPIIKQAIFEYHSNMFPAYLKPKETRPKLSPEDQARHKIEQAALMKEAKEKALYEEKLALAKEALAEDIYKEGEYWYAKIPFYEYYNDARITKGYQTFAFEDLHPDVLKEQFLGAATKEEILARYAELTQ